MTQSSYDVVEVVAMQLIGSDASVIPVTTELSFRTSDPYTVRAVFTGPHTMSTWLLGRELVEVDRGLARQLVALLDAPEPGEHEHCHEAGALPEAGDE